MGGWTYGFAMSNLYLLCPTSLSFPCPAYDFAMWIAWSPQCLLFTYCMFMQDFQLNCGLMLFFVLSVMSLFLEALYSRSPPERAKAKSTYGTMNSRPFRFTGCRSPQETRDASLSPENTERSGHRKKHMLNRFMIYKNWLRENGFHLYSLFVSWHWQLNQPLAQSRGLMHPIVSTNT